MQREDDELPRGRSPFGTVPFVALCLFIGFWGFVYDGYSEDARRGQADIAWIGVVEFGVAGLSILRAVAANAPGKAGPGDGRHAAARRGPCRTGSGCHLHLRGQPV